MIPPVGSYWRNPRSGNVYWITLISNEHADKDRRKEYPVIINYCGYDRKRPKKLKHWAVTLEHWERRGFEPNDVRASNNQE